jgi:hypothetical protein
MPAPEADTPPADYCAERTAMMPKRRRTRAQDRAYKVATERAQNHQARQADRREREAAYSTPAPPGDGDDPPPF